jgi:nitrate reductase gamma subunit
LRVWAQLIVTFRPLPSVIVGVPIVYKIHLVLGMTLFALVPFSRLVHIWSGFAAVFYLLRPYQVVRPRGR